MYIWFDKTLTLEKIKPLVKDFMPGYLGMQWIEVGDDYLRMSMPVEPKTQQIYGFLHGGASCALAETIGSIASALVLDLSKSYCVGLEINANHIRTVTKGKVIATASPLHLGRTTHVWDIKIHDEENHLICVSRHTTAIISKDKI